MEILGQYYDGRTSLTSEVRLVFTGDGTVQIFGEAVSLQFALSELDVASRIGNTPRTIRLPDGGKCEVWDNDTLDSILTMRGQTLRGNWIHRLESSLIYVVFAVVITAGCAWGMVNHGIPWLAKRAAYALPPSVDRELGRGTLEILDRSTFATSSLSKTDQTRLKNRFRTMVQDLVNGNEYRLEFRKGQNIGANAFALPSGIVVVTDELVEISHNDDEVVAVLAHEIGHLSHRHSLRMVMQDSALALLISVVTGDPFSTSTLAVALPTLLVHTSYSRDFEYEADAYAYDYLVANQIPTESFANILSRLGDEDTHFTVGQFLASHPGTHERSKRFRHH